MGYHTGEQIRAARAMLGWEQTELATRANVSVKTIKRLEAISGPIDARSEWSVVHALELAGIDFIGSHDWRDRSEGVRFAKDRNAKLRRKLIEDTEFALDYELKEITEKDPDFFERPTADIAAFVLEKLGPSLTSKVQNLLNRNE
jgi:transcriptional regulator with XRE-family HTH domain